MQDHQLKWWQVRWGLAGRAIARLAVVSGEIVGVLALIAAVGFGAVYFMRPWLDSRGMSRVDPGLSAVPLNLPNHGRAALSHATLDCYGFRLLLPNREIVHIYKGDLTTLVMFRGGGLIEIPNTSRQHGIFDFANRDKRASGSLGQELLHSKFKLMQAAMSATPGQVKWWRFRSSLNKRIDFLLLTKLEAFTEAGFFGLRTFPPYAGRGPIYTIASGEIRGFQFGDPDVAPYDAHLDLFDGADRYFAFDVTRPDGHGQVLTQEEINAIVASIQPESAR